MHLGRVAAPELLRPVSINDAALNTTVFYARSISYTALDIGLSSVLFGILTLLVVVAVGFLMRKGFDHTPVRILLPSTLILYGSTALFMASLVGHVASVRLLVAQAQDGLFSDAYTNADLDAFEGDVLRHAWMMTIALFINVLIGDSIVWWRVCAVWKNRTVYFVGPLLIVLMIVFGAKGVCREQQCLHPPQQAQPLLGNNFFTNACAVLSLAINLLATMLIGSKSWMHRRLLRGYFGRQQSHVLNALALLVESGTIYCFLLIIVVVRQVSPAHLPTPSVHQNAFFSAIADYNYSCFIPVIAIYPVLIIVIVALNWSPIEHSLKLSDGGDCTHNQADGGPYPTSVTGAGMRPYGATMSTVVLADTVQIRRFPNQSTSSEDSAMDAETKLRTVTLGA